MPTFLLCIKAELENIGSIKIKPDSRFCLTVQEAAGEEVKEGVYVCSTEQNELSGSKGTANLVLKFAKGSKKEASVNVMMLKGVTRDYTADDAEKFVPVVAFECRGLTPIGYQPEDDFIVEAASGKKFDDVDLKELEWCDYDDKGDCSVGIYKFESKFQLHKG